LADARLRAGVIGLNPDSEVGGIVLVLVVVLICRASAPKREPDPSAIILFDHSDREICRILEHEHDFSTSAFR
jgi:hypothetical protein